MVGVAVVGVAVVVGSGVNVVGVAVVLGRVAAVVGVAVVGVTVVGVTAVEVTDGATVLATLVVGANVLGIVVTSGVARLAGNSRLARSAVVGGVRSNVVAGALVGGVNVDAGIVGDPATVGVVGSGDGASAEVSGPIAATMALNAVTEAPPAKRRERVAACLRGDLGREDIPFSFATFGQKDERYRLIFSLQRATSGCCDGPRVALLEQLDRGPIDRERLTPVILLADKIPLRFGEHVTGGATATEAVHYLGAATNTNGGAVCVGVEFKELPIVCCRAEA